MGKRAIVYARVSSDEQADKGYSLTTQLEACRKYAELHGFEVVGEFQDDYSGAKLDRPGLDAARLMLESQAADAIIIYAADRLTRNLAHSLILREEFKRMGIELHYVNRGKSEDTAESRLTENIESVIAEFEREKIRERTRRGRLAKAQAGKWVAARVPYGFRKVGLNHHAHLEIDEEQAGVVHRIIDQLLGRNGYAPTPLVAVARQLTQEGVPPPKPGKGWWSNSIYRIVKGRAVLGEIKSMGQKLFFPELAIISEAVYDEVQARLERNRKIYKRPRKYPYLFSGFAKCVCGSGLSGKSIGRGDWENFYYVCGHHPDKHIVQCNEKGINVRIFEPLVWNWLVELLTDDAKLEKGIRAYFASRETELTKTRERRATTEELIARADRRIGRLTADLRELESDSARAAIKADLDRIGKEKDSLLVTLRALDAELEERAVSESDIETIRATARQIRAKLLGEPTYEQKRELFAAIDLNIQLRHNEHGRELYVTCGLKLEGQALALPPRVNYVVKSPITREKLFNRIIVFEAVLPLPRRVNAADLVRPKPTPVTRSTPTYAAAAV